MSRVWLPCLVAGVVLGGSAMGCSDKPSLLGAAGAACSSNEDCAAGTVCYSAHCAEVCNRTADCDDSALICAGGVCQPECLIDADCLSPGTCQVAAGARCVSQACSYADAQVGTACDDANPCTDDACDGAGVCVSTANACQPCSTPGDCVAPPSSYVDCFNVDCVLGYCVYQAQPNEVCQAAGCADAVLTAARTCGTDGTCPSTARQPCNGYDCNVAGDACLTTCATQSDCAGALACQGDFTCESPRQDGASCAVAGECASTYCVDSVCCDAACDGVCQRCDAVDGTAGQCHVAAAGDDPDNECTDSVTNCSTDVCSGTGPACGTKSGGTSCGTCRSCSVTGQCQVNSTDHDDCAACEKCASGSCIPQTNSEDLKDACANEAGCGTGWCNGAGACDAVAAGSQSSACNGAATSCSAADSCDGVGGCDINDFSSGTGCDICGECNGAGTCNPITAANGNNCNDDCSACNAGSCQSRAAGATDECPSCYACTTAGGDCTTYTCCSPNYGQTCSACNCLGECNGGTYNCSGTCSASAPSPSCVCNVGQPCQACNSCGCGAVGSYNCNGTCGGSAFPATCTPFCTCNPPVYTCIDSCCAQTTSGC